MNDQRDTIQEANRMGFGDWLLPAPDGSPCAFNNLRSGTQHYHSPSLAELIADSIVTFVTHGLPEGSTFLDTWLDVVLHARASLFQTKKGTA